MTKLVGRSTPNCHTGLPGLLGDVQRADLVAFTREFYGQRLLSVVGFTKTVKGNLSALLGRGSSSDFGRADDTGTGGGKGRHDSVLSE
eukprot:CAMPEP_0203770468 /NCGR_PEP_ID=MMETSP0099_2-20121227/2836_1 /ASSEMBLY_ACC=CAM_ASM_000209 /TAXON_ID=96639 /ORGANISM=" , Strain NY0313808BC1" /LENGTH=87 /DNA_ID=CAMNT_0050667625 /DNA_START=1157 /DNA_END=1421 /DNA_ORIENTATION=-